jgi:hypothetical protein
MCQIKFKIDLMEKLTASEGVLLIKQLLEHPKINKVSIIHIGDALDENRT